VTSLKTLTARARIARRQRSAGLSIAQVHGEHLPDHLDPFLALDHFEMAQPFFPPHPHAGFSAVTYMFPRSRNGFVNRDSHGTRVEIGPGDLHWTAAGSGILHEEVPITRGVPCHGLQIFVDLATAQKWMAPRVLHLDAGDVPRLDGPGVDLRVVLGRHGDLRSPLVPPTDVTLLDLVLAPGGVLDHVVPAREARFVYVIDGRVDVGPPSASARLEAGEAAGLSQTGDRLVVGASDGGAHVIIAGGVPLREPRVFHGPFCMATPEDVVRAMADYQAGRMGRLEPSF
jgi:redox-sensitive bicupin YhaK (pirin superfamily)